MGKISRPRKMAKNEGAGLIEINSSPSSKTHSIKTFLVSHRTLGLIFVMLGPVIQAMFFGLRVINWVPVWSWYTDPGYVYLFNGAVIIQGGVPGHTDHPGTSTQWLIGSIEQLTYWVTGSRENLFADIVWNPESYAKVVSSVFLIVYIFATAYLGYQMWRYFGTAVAIITQFLFIWTISLMGSGVFKLVPETVVLLAFLVLLALMIPSLKNPRRGLGIAALLFIGIICAIGMTSKIIFLPALLLPIILLTIRNLMVVVLGFVVSGILIMLPTVPRLGQMWNWYAGVLLSSGRHGGQSEKNLLENLSNAAQGLTGIARWWALIYIALLALSFGFVVVSLLRKRFGLKPLSLVALVMVSFGVFAIGYKQSETRDFILIAPTIALLAGILVYLYRQLCSLRVGELVSVTSIIAASFLGAHGLVGSVYAYPLVTDRSEDRVESAQAMNDLSEIETLAQSYDSWTESGALSFGEYWSNGEFARELNERFPVIFEYSIFDQGIYSWNSGDGRRLASCPELSLLAQSTKFYIVVPSLGTLNIDPSLTKIYSKNGTISVIEKPSIGTYSTFQVMNVQCSGATDQ